MLRRLIAFVLTPFIIGVLIAVFAMAYTGRFDDISSTMMFICSMTFVFSFLFGLPPYLWLRWKKNYSIQPIVKTGIVVEGIVGLMYSLITSQYGAILVGLFFGFIGSLLFHFIHGNVAVTKSVME